MASIAFVINGPNQESLNTMIALFAESKGWREESGFTVTEFAKSHLDTYIRLAIDEASQRKLDAKQQAEREALRTQTSEMTQLFSTEIK